jgi:hypothetical protein
VYVPCVLQQSVSLLLDTGRGLRGAGAPEELAVAGGVHGPAAGWEAVRGAGNASSNGRRLRAIGSARCTVLARPHTVLPIVFGWCGLPSREPNKSFAGGVNPAGTSPT